MNNREKTSVAVHEVPQIVVQAILAYNRDPTRESYPAFVLRVDRTILQVSMSALSRTYVEELCRGKPLSGSLRLCRSVRYDMLERDERREALRLLVGLVRFLDTSNIIDGKR